MSRAVAARRRLVGLLLPALLGLAPRLAAASLPRLLLLTLLAALLLPRGLPVSTALARGAAALPALLLWLGRLAVSALARPRLVLLLRREPEDVLPHVLKRLDNLLVAAVRVALADHRALSLVEVGKEHVLAVAAPALVGKRGLDREDRVRVFHRLQVREKGLRRVGKEAGLDQDGLPAGLHPEAQLVRLPVVAHAREVLDVLEPAADALRGLANGISVLIEHVAEVKLLAVQEHVGALALRRDLAEAGLDALASRVFAEGGLDRFEKGACIRVNTGG